MPFRCGRGSAKRMPLYSTGIGKAILAYSGEDELATVLASGLERRTPSTITDPIQLRTELQRIRMRGYSTDMEENEESVRCVAAPIFDHRLSVVGAISIAGPAFRFPEQRMGGPGHLCRWRCARGLEAPGVHG